MLFSKPRNPKRVVPKAYLRSLRKVWFVHKMPGATLLHLLEKGWQANQISLPRRVDDLLFPHRSFGPQFCSETAFCVRWGALGACGDGLFTPLRHGNGSGRSVVECRCRQHSMDDTSLTAVGKSALVWLSSALFFGPSFFFMFPPPPIPTLTKGV